jgi:prepilin-type N-terminal cleavage/methylation domain-containing protein
MMRHRRLGYTLTELLVVMTIMASLMGLVVASSRPSTGASDDIRRGAQQLASILLKSQSDSLGKTEGAAVILDSTGSWCEAISHARRHPFIEGRVTAGMPPADPGVTQVYVSLTTENDSADSLVHGYRVRFLDRGVGTQGPPSDWFSFSCATPPTAIVRYRTEEGQTSQTALWPTAPQGGELAFQVARYPIPTGIAEILPKGVVVDLRHSGYSDTSLVAWNTLSGQGAIAVGFDAVGSMDTLMQNVLPGNASVRTTQPLSPAEDVYLFVTARSDVEDPTVNALANDKAMWVVIHPKTGRVTISANVPQLGIDPPALCPPSDSDSSPAARATWAAWAKSLEAARANALQGITIGG